MTKTESRTETDKSQEVYEAAYELFSQNPDWVTFFRRILGLHGLIRRTFPTPNALAEFEKTPTYAQIQQLLTVLRKRKPAPVDGDEPTRVITVRLPKSLHEALRVEAYEHCTSMNKLCISKLLQFIDTELVPSKYGQYKHEEHGADL